MTTPADFAAFTVDDWLVEFDAIVHPERWCPACLREQPVYRAGDGCQECLTQEGFIGDLQGAS